MLEGRRIGAVLLMGGTGRRFGSNVPKQFHRLAGKPIFLHTLHVFLKTGFFDEIILSCHCDWIEFAQKSCSVSDGIVKIVPSGATRQESSWRGLMGFSCPPDIVVMHDAVRPFVSEEIIRNSIKTALDVGAADTCISSNDTLVYAPGQEMISSIPRRADYLRGQTPQTFVYSQIIKAHQKTSRQDCSDDCQLAIDAGHPVGVVLGDEKNIKITSSLDLFFAEQLLRHRFAVARPRQNPSSLGGRRYAIVGGTGGIGRTVERLIIDCGGKAFVLGRRTSPISINLQSASSICQAFAQLGPLDGLVNCAGHLRVARLKDLKIKEIDEMLDVNLRGLVLCCKQAQLRPGSCVVNIASSSFSRGRADATIYSCAKAGVVNFTQGWAEERPDLRIYAVIPQRTNTALRRVNFPNEDIAELLEPAQVGQAVVDLLTESDISGLLVEVRKP
jgi:2-C-methyl-D-erythritol 4-phosphate cytidylyltransferase